MRRIRHLDQCDYIVPIGIKSSQLLALSNQSNVLLERPWHSDSSPEYSVKIHARFSSENMDGIEIVCRLLRSGELSQSAVDSVQLYSVSNTTWAETLVGQVTMAEESPGVFSGYVTQAALGSLELSGREVFAVVCTMRRRRRLYVDKVWFSHIGSFDSIVRLRRYVDGMEIMKVDE